MDDKELILELRTIKGQLTDFKSDRDRLYGQLLGLSACVSASCPEFSEQEAKDRIDVLAGSPNLSDTIREYAGHAIRHVLNARSLRTKNVH